MGTTLAGGLAGDTSRDPLSVHPEPALHTVTTIRSPDMTSARPRPTGVHTQVGMSLKPMAHRPNRLGTTMKLKIKRATAPTVFLSAYLATSPLISLAGDSWVRPWGNMKEPRTESSQDTQSGYLGRYNPWAHANESQQSPDTVEGGPDWSSWSRQTTPRSSQSPRSQNEEQWGTDSHWNNNDYTPWRQEPQRNERNSTTNQRGKQPYGEPYGVPLYRAPYQGIYPYGYGYNPYGESTWTSPLGGAGALPGLWGW